MLACRARGWCQRDGELRRPVCPMAPPKYKQICPGGAVVLSLLPPSLSTRTLWHGGSVLSQPDPPKSPLHPCSCKVQAE